MPWTDPLITSFVQPITSSLCILAASSCLTCCADVRRGGAPLGIKWCIRIPAGHSTLALQAYWLQACALAARIAVIVVGCMCWDYARGSVCHISFGLAACTPLGLCCCLLVIVPAVAATLQGCLVCVFSSPPLWKDRLCWRTVLHACRTQLRARAADATLCQS